MTFVLFYFFQGNLKEEINQLQDIEKRVKDKVTELTEKKTNFKVKQSN